MNYDDLLSLVKKRRSFRRFTSEPVSKEIVRQVLEGGRHVPSAGDAQLKVLDWRLLGQLYRAVLGKRRSKNF